MQRGRRSRARSPPALSQQRRARYEWVGGPLLETFAGDQRVAAAVSQLRDPAGQISEAGGVIWNDGQGSNYGRGASPHDWRYRSPRDVDYGSGEPHGERRGVSARRRIRSRVRARVLRRRRPLLSLARSGRTHRVSAAFVVSHAEGVSTEATHAPRLARRRNAVAQTFAQRWAGALREHLRPIAATSSPHRAGSRGRTMLVVDEHVPFADRDAGSRRIAFLVDLLRERGWRVVFASLDGAEYEPYASMLRSTGVDVITGFGPSTLTAMKRKNVRLDAAWLSRPEPAARVLATIRREFGVPIVFDTVDLHYRRLEREERALGRKTKWRAMRRREFALAREADVTVTGGSSECALLRAEGIAHAFEFPVIEPLPPAPLAPWDERSEILFLGNYAHAPNVDAARWLCQAIMPIVWRNLPDVRLTIAGADPTRAVRALARPRVEVAGYVADAAALLAGARIFVVPLRFGAGTKGKTVYALAAGIPVVSTTVGAEDIFSAAEYDDTPDEPERFAARVVELYTDRVRWERLSAAGRAIAARFTPAAAGRRLDAVLALLGNRR